MLQRSPWPILEFDDAAASIVRADLYQANPETPPAAVGCYFREVIAHLAASSETKIIDVLEDEAGIRPVYSVNIDGQRLAVFHPGVGAPSAAASLEIVIARGVRRVVFCGGAGVIADSAERSRIVVASSALRDEGTSYHYLPATREVAAASRAVTAIADVLSGTGSPFVIGRTWTTDAPFRETDARVAARREEGCLIVEMEAAAVFAVAQARGIDCGCLFYGADTVNRADWIGFGRNEYAEMRAALFHFAAQACISMQHA